MTLLHRPRFARVLPIVLATFLTSLGGCQSQTAAPRPTPGPDMAVDPPANIEASMPDHADGDPTTVRSVHAPRTPRYTDAQIQQRIRQAQLDLQRTIVISEEQIDLADGPEPSQAMADIVQRRLTDVGLHIIHVDQPIPLTAGVDQLQRLGAGQRAHLAVLLQADARSIDQLDNFHSFEAQVRGRLVNLDTGRIIAVHGGLHRGERALDPQLAGESALAAAGRDAGVDLVDELVRQWEVTSLQRVDLVVKVLETAEQVDQLALHLQAQPGLHLVSLASWDAASQQAVLALLVRVDVLGSLPTLIEQYGDARVQVLSIEQRGRVLRAVQTPRS